MKKGSYKFKNSNSITIPANVKHWHNAKKGSWFSHIAVEVSGEDAKTEWCDPVSDEKYDRLGE